MRAFAALILLFGLSAQAWAGTVPASAPAGQADLSSEGDGAPVRWNKANLTDEDKTKVIQLVDQILDTRVPAKSAGQAQPAASAGENSAR